MSSVRPVAALTLPVSPLLPSRVFSSEDGDDIRDKYPPGLAADARWDTLSQSGLPSLPLSPRDTQPTAGTPSVSTLPPSVPPPVPAPPKTRPQTTLSTRTVASVELDADTQWVIAKRDTNIISLTSAIPMYILSPLPSCDSHSQYAPVPAPSPGASTSSFDLTAAPGPIHTSPRSYTPDVKADPTWDVQRYDRDGTVLRTMRDTTTTRKWPLATRFVLILVLALVLIALSVAAIVLSARHAATPAPVSNRQ